MVARVESEAERLQAEEGQLVVLPAVGLHPAIIRHHAVVTRVVPKVVVPVVVTAILHQLVSPLGVVAMEEGMEARVNVQHHLQHPMHRSSQGMAEAGLRHRALLMHPHHRDMVVAAAIVEEIICA